MAICITGGSSGIGRAIAERFAGRGSLSMPTVSSVAPWHLLAPRRIVECYFGVYDFDLLHGKVLHDYLEDDEMWG
ncbi:MAG: hypothetical protein R2725_09760 [Solirubrobacterales bacterium]